MADVLSSMTSVYQVIIGMFANIIDMITGNALVFVPVLLGILGGLVIFCNKFIRRLGVRGISSSGGRRRRR